MKGGPVATPSRWRGVSLHVTDHSWPLSSGLKLRARRVACSRRWRRTSRLLPVSAALLGLTAGLVVAAFATPGSEDGLTRAAVVAGTDADAVLSPSSVLDVDPPASEERELLRAVSGPETVSDTTVTPPAVAGVDSPSLPLGQAVEFSSLPAPAAVGALLIADRIAIEQPLAALAPRAVDFLTTRKGRVSVAVIDLNDGSAYTHGRADRYELASVGKVAILVTFLERARLEHLELTPNEQQLLHDMITLSDGDATTAIWVRSGRVSGVGAMLNRIGLGEPRIRVVEGDWGGMTATALDVALLFAEVGAGHVLSEESRGYALTLLEDISEAQSWGMSAGFSNQGGRDDRLALKNGWWTDSDSLEWIVHSAAVVTDRDGRGRYAVAILSDSQPTYGYGIETLEGIAREIHRVPSLPFGISPINVAFWR